MYAISLFQETATTLFVCQGRMNSCVFVCLLWPLRPYLSLTPYMALRYFFSPKEERKKTFCLEEEMRSGDIEARKIAALSEQKVTDPSSAVSCLTTERRRSDF